MTAVEQKRRLDPAQEVAAASMAPATLVLAGPGSGKTMTLTRRIELLIEQGVDARRILALTFTRGAAAEMERRVNLKLGLGRPSLDDEAGLQSLSDKQNGCVSGSTPVRLVVAGRDQPSHGVQIRTFHSWGLMLIKEDPRRFGLGDIALPGAGDLLVWDDETRRGAISRLCGRNLSESDLCVIDGFRERGAAASDIERMGWVGVAGQALDRALSEAGAIDMVSMVSRIVEACAADADYCHAMTGRYDHILVDEYQDVSPIQESLVRLFFENGVTLWAVGDDDQTLYGFRAADVRHVTEFSRRYGGCNIVTLNHNYRSTPAIVEAAAALIGHNKQRTHKAQRSVDVGPQVVLRGYESAEHEVAAVTQAVIAMLELGVSGREIAVLTRTRLICEAFTALAGDDPRFADVEVMTIHGAKGREWEYVFVAGVEEGVLPHRDSVDIEEERRILFVAMTRARYGLALTFSGLRRGQPRSISRFVRETGVSPWTSVDRVMGLSSEGAIMPTTASQTVSVYAAPDAYQARRVGAQPRTGTPWDETDDAKLINMFDQGVALSVMADRLGRNDREVVWRVERLGRAGAGDGARVIKNQERRREMGEFGRAC